MSGDFKLLHMTVVDKSEIFFIVFNFYGILLQNLAKNSARGEKMGLRWSGIYTSIKYLIKHFLQMFINI